MKWENILFVKFRNTIIKENKTGLLKTIKKKHVKCNSRNMISFIKFKLQNKKAAKTGSQTGKNVTV